MNAPALLRVEDLVVDYLNDAGRVRAVDGVSLSIAAGEAYGLCGESGSGKSSLALALGRLLAPPAVISRGQIWLKDVDLLALAPGELRRVRGRQLGFVPQSAMNALNPLLTVEAQIADVLFAHESPRPSRKVAAARARELLAAVDLPEAVATAYAHELSGGMRQRAVLAVALAGKPSLLILDEATGSLDVLVQQQLCQRLGALIRTLGFAVLFISHDLPLTLALCQRVGILYAGKLVEESDVAAFRRGPRHPYAQALLDCFLDPRRRRPGGPVGIAGDSPDPRAFPSGCRFHPRCPAAFDRCPREEPLFTPRRGAGNVKAACHLPDIEGVAS